MKKEISRRQFIGLAAASAGPFFLFPRRAEASRKKLRILQWKHPVPGYDRWFNEVLAAGWGHEHDTRVIVDFAAPEAIHQRAAAEAAAGKGHDIVVFPSPPADFEQHLVDHRDIYREVRRHWGEVIELGYKSTFNPRTKRHFAFCDAYVPAPFLWLRGAWTKAGLPLGPRDYDTLRRVGATMRRSQGLACGLGMSEEQGSNVSMFSLLWSFGGMVQDENGRVALESPETVEALRFMKAFYQETETPEVLRWGPESASRSMLGGRISCTVNALAIARMAERRHPNDDGQIMVSPALRAQVGPYTPPYITQCYAVWNFAENQEGARQFLAALPSSSKEAFLASRFCNFPCYPKTVPDLLPQIESDPSARPPGKYEVLRDTLFWTRNIGYPGYATAAAEEVFRTFVVPRMFSRVARGELSPEEAARAGAREVENIFARWRQGTGE